MRAVPRSASGRRRPPCATSSGIRHRRPGIWRGRCSTRRRRRWSGRSCWWWCSFHCRCGATVARPPADRARPDDGYWDQSQPVEHGAHPRRVRVAHLLKERECFPPTLLSRPGVAGGVVILAESDEGVGFVVGVAILLPMDASLLIAPGGPLVVSHLLVNEGNAFPRVSFSRQIIKFPGRCKCLFAEGKCPLVITQSGKRPAKRVD